MNKNLLFFVVLMLLIKGVIASPIDETIARRVAEKFITSRSQQYSMVLNHGGIKTILPLKESENYAYAINFMNGGFVIVSADNAAKPVIAYSYDGQFLPNEVPVAVKEWMEIYSDEIEDIRRNNIPATQEISQEWDELLSDNYTAERDNREISPLLTTTWDQGARYNDLCPEDPGGPGGKVWAGCVATAMAQVMNYWRYPLTGTGSHGYYSNYGYLFVDYANSSYDYDQMNASIGGESNYEMAEIQYHCGVSVNMMYSPSGSGAYSDDAADALKTYFGYASSLELEYKDYYTEADWCTLLIENLDAGQPMYYHGFGSGGHAFNVDGYQGTNYFHFNWGWSGSYNGYYYLNNLNPGGNNFTNGQGAIVNFIPDPVNYPYYCAGAKTLTRHNGTLEDGSGPVSNYTSGLNCGWLIAPEDSVSNLTLIFDKFDLASGDVLNIYDGEDNSAPLIGSFSGTDLPGNLIPASGMMFIEFLTSGNSGKGWKVHYTSSLVNYCEGVTNYTEPSGTFSDGSGNREYRNNSICKYIIEPENAATITLTFDQLDTEPDIDKIKIYDMISQQLIAEVSGTEIPEAITVPSGKAYVIFVTNSSVTAPGWQISYTSTVTGNTDYSIGELIVSCSPNPADHWLRTEINSLNPQNIIMELVSLDGKKFPVYNGKIESGNKIIMTDVSLIEPGIYMLRYNTTASSGSRKIIIM